MFFLLDISSMKIFLLLHIYYHSLGPPQPITHTTLGMSPIVCYFNTRFPSWTVSPWICVFNVPPSVTELPSLTKIFSLTKQSTLIPNICWMYGWISNWIDSVQFSLVQLFATPWTAACQASLSITNSRSLPKLTSLELVLPFNHLILSHPLLLPPSVFPVSGSFQMNQFFISGG